MIEAKNQVLSERTRPANGVGLRRGVLLALCSAAFLAACATGDTKSAITNDAGHGTDSAPTDSGTDPTSDSTSSSDDSFTPLPDSGGTTTTAPTTDSGSTPTDTTTTPPADTSTPPADTGPCVSLIDDMEHVDGAIKVTCGRIGYWYTFNDATVGGTQTPAAGASFLMSDIPSGRGSSVKAAHTSGSGFTVWGAGMGFDMNNPGGTATKTTYNAGAYNGLHFWAKAASSLSVRMNVNTKQTDALGGLCSPAAKCGDHYGSTLSLTSSWQEFTIPFSTLHQLGWGMATSFDDTQIYAVQFQVDKSTAFDFWVDDISFTP